MNTNTNVVSAAAWLAAGLVDAGLVDTALLYSVRDERTVSKLKVM